MRENRDEINNNFGKFFLPVAYLAMFHLTKSYRLFSVQNQRKFPFPNQHP